MNLHLSDPFPQPIKAPESVATIITSESVFYKVCCLFLPSENSSMFLFNVMFFYLWEKESNCCHPQCFYLCAQGVYYQTGDVIKVTDEEDGKPYYAQIRGFVQDQYCEKSAALTWLIPTQASPKDQFDPGTYIVGEEFLRFRFFLNFSCLWEVKKCLFCVRSRGGSA